MSTAIPARTPFIDRGNTDRFFTGPERKRRDEAVRIGESLLEAAKESRTANSGTKLSAAKARLAALRQAAQMAAAAGDTRTARNIAAQASRLAREAGMSAKGANSPELDQSLSEVVAEARSIIATARRAAKPGSKEDTEMAREASGLRGIGGNTSMVSITA